MIVFTLRTHNVITFRANRPAHIAHSVLPAFVAFATHAARGSATEPAALHETLDGRLFLDQVEKTLLIPSQDTPGHAAAPFVHHGRAPRVCAGER